MTGCVLQVASLCPCAQVNVVGPGVAPPTAPCGARRAAKENIYDAVEAVMPGFRKDFAAISERVKRLQPWLDQAHARFVATEMEFDRVYIPF
jgi:hypothetical protein